MTPTLAVALERPAQRHDAQHHEGDDEEGEDRGEHVATLGGVTAARHNRVMTSLLSPPANVMDVLRGDPRSRPSASTAAASTLRSRLDEGIISILGPDARPVPLLVNAASVRVSVPSQSASSPLAQVRGIVVTHALRLLSVGAHVDDLAADALCAWRSEVDGDELTRHVDRLDAEERARLTTDVAAHCVTLKRSLGPLPSRWLPRTSVRAHQRLAAGAVIVRDVVDLMVGTTTSDTASVALLDVTTSPLDEGAERVVRYHALVQTLRTNVTPLRSAIFSTATGDLWCHDVTDELLGRAVGDVLDAVERRSRP